jgi:hypothetical protein
MLNGSNRSRFVYFRFCRWDGLNHWNGLKFSEQPNHPSDNPKLALRDGDRRVLLVLRFERDHTVFLEEAFQRRLALDQRAHDVAIFRLALLLNDHPVAVQDTRIDHAVAFDSQGKGFSAAHVLGNSQISFEVFFTEQRFTGGHLAQNWHIPGGADRRVPERIDDLDGALAYTADVTLFLQGLQMIGDAVGRSDSELSADFLNRRREAFFPNGLEQKIVDRFLPIGERGQHEVRYTEFIFSSQASKKLPLVPAGPRVPIGGGKRSRRGTQ